jgi:hypothetical protein
MRIIRSVFGHAYDTLCGSFYEHEFRHQMEASDHSLDKTRRSITYRVYSILGTVVDIPKSVFEQRDLVHKKYEAYREDVQLALNNRLTLSVSEPYLHLDDNSRRPDYRGGKRKASPGKQFNGFNPVPSSKKNKKKKKRNRNGNGNGNNTPGSSQPPRKKQRTSSFTP